MNVLTSTSTRNTDTHDPWLYSCLLSFPAFVLPTVPYSTSTSYTHTTQTPTTQFPKPILPCNLFTPPICIPSNKPSKSPASRVQWVPGKEQSNNNNDQCPRRIASCRKATRAVQKKRAVHKRAMHTKSNTHKEQHPQRAVPNPRQKMAFSLKFPS